MSNYTGYNDESDWDDYNNRDDADIGPQVRRQQTLIQTSSDEAYNERDEDTISPRT